MRGANVRIVVCGLVALSMLLIVPMDVSDDGIAAGDSGTAEDLPLEASADVDPDTLNLKSKGKWVTAYITPPEGYDASEISAHTPIFEVGGEYGEFSTAMKWDVQGDVLMVKFSRAQVIDAITAFEMMPEISANIMGEMEDGMQFECEGRWVYTGAGWRWFEH